MSNSRLIKTSLIYNDILLMVHCIGFLCFSVILKMNEIKEAMAPEQQNGNLNTKIEINGIIVYVVCWVLEFVRLTQTLNQQGAYASWPF